MRVIFHLVGRASQWPSCWCAACRLGPICSCAVRGTTSSSTADEEAATTAAADRCCNHASATTGLVTVATADAGIVDTGRETDVGPGSVHFGQFAVDGGGGGGGGASVAGGASSCHQITALTAAAVVRCNASATTTASSAAWRPEDRGRQAGGTQVYSCMLYITWAKKAISRLHTTTKTSSRLKFADCPNA